MDHLEAPSLTFLADMELTVEGAHAAGRTTAGERRIIRVTGGRMRGEVNAGVVPGGDDWITVREDGTILQDVRILLHTDDDAYIMMTYRGIRTGPKSVLEQLDRNEEVDPSAYYFRTAPVFETASPAYDWLNRRLFVSRGIRLPGKVNYSIYTVD
ncbi:DUF3237 domain-containing protein [Salibacterium sp. K-3]